MAELFRSLGDPTRVRIFWLLSHREECVINIAAMLDMSSPAVSHHLRSLAENGLLESRRDGKEVYYRAPDTVQGQLLHEIVEQVMEIACPEKSRRPVRVAGGDHPERPPTTWSSISPSVSRSKRCRASF